jgi:predicted membrane protein
MNGIFVSKKTAKLIEEHPFEGEIVLAHELALLKREKLFLNFLRNICAFYYGLIIEGMIFAEIILSVLPLLESTSLWIPALLLSYPWGFGIAFWYYQRARAEMEVESMYNMNPEIATFKVFARKNMTEVGRSHYTHEIESNIEKRKSRTLFNILGTPLALSTLIASVVFILTVVILTSFTTLLTVFVGGISFTFLAYGASSKGTNKPRKPESARDRDDDEPPRADDEVSRQVASHVSMTENNNECIVSYFTEGDIDDGLYIVSVLDRRVYISEEEWNALSSAELISAYVEGSFASRRHTVPNLAYIIIFLLFLATLVSGFILFIPRMISSFLLLVVWVFLSFVILAILIMGIQIPYQRRSLEAELDVAKRNPHYVKALQTLAKSQDVYPTCRTQCERQLKKLNEHLVPIEK